MQIVQSEVSEIYKSQYADRVRYDDLPAGIDYATLDGAVNSGVSRGAKWLQASVGATSDGVVGDQTVAKAKSTDAVKTVKAICARRLSFVRGLRTWATFGKGWNRRIAGVEANGVKMSLAAAGMSAKGITAIAEADADVASKNARSQTVLAGSTTLPATSAATSAAGSAVVTDVSTATIVGLTLVAVGLVVLAVYLFRKSSINRARAEAYAIIAQETANV